MKIQFLQNLGINESLALADLSAYLKSKGHICDLLIESDEKLYISKIEDFSADLFVVPWDIGTKNWIIKTARIIHSISNSPAVFCGTYPSFYPDRAIGTEGIEMICIGETEYALHEFTECLDRSETLEGVRNIWLKRSGSVIKNELRPLIEDLDSIPLPDRNLYFKYRYIRDMSFKRFTSGRGCMNSCRFCYNPLFRSKYSGKGTYVRRKSVDRIIEEILAVSKIAALKTIHFSDDIFTIDKAWLADFGSRYRDRVNIPFTCNATADSIDEECVRILAESNCSGIALGIESGNQDYRNFILNKRITNEQIEASAAMIKEKGIFLTTFNMLALPGETPEGAFETIQLNARIKTDHIRLSFASPLPGTQLAEYGIEKGYFKREDIEDLLDNTIYPDSAVLDTDTQTAFNNIFILFRFAVVMPFLIPLIRRIYRSRFIRPISFFNNMLNALGEKRFFRITWGSGIRYMFNAGSLRRRTKVYNNFMP